jgi:hypothetical protein
VGAHACEKAFEFYAISLWYNGAIQHPEAPQVADH